METIIYGGSFNPPTIAHQTIMERCLMRDDVDEVWVMPSGVREDKQNQLSDELRLYMLELVKHDAFNDDPRLVISDFELDLPRPTMTHQTVQALEQAYPDRQFRYIFGADSLATMETWEHGERLRHQLGMLIVPRSGIEIVKTPNIEVVAGLAELEMSSSEVRARVAYDVSIEDMVCPAVQAYIDECRLYQAAAV